MTTLLVTGANRGIGLEHVRQALAQGETVIATCRDPESAADLQGLAATYGADRLRLEVLDVNDPDSIHGLASRLRGVPVDILINNAGVYGKPGSPGWPDGASNQSISAMDYEHWDLVFRTNVMAPFRIAAALMPNLLAGGKRTIVMMSSELGSIARNTKGTSHAYRSSKAALNMLAHGMAIDLKDQGVIVVALAPGWTRTELGGGQAELEVDQSVAGQREVLAGLTLADSGKFLSRTGEELPW